MLATWSHWLLLILDSVRSACSSFTLCSLCSCTLHGRHHFHPASWSDSLQAFFKEQVSSQSDVCVCKACDSCIRRSLNKHERREVFKFCWVKEEKMCVPFCNAVDVKASTHAFTWEEICSCVGIGSIACTSGGNLCLCVQHY